MKIACRLVALLCLPLAATTARAEAAADFYRGKTVTIVVASGAGGGYDFFGRALAKHMSRHIPGNPTLIVQNMPGAGGARMVNYLYNVGPQDGTTLGVPLAPAAMAQVLDPSPSIKYDATKLYWIGNLENSVGILFVWHGSPAKTVADVMTRVTPLAGSGKSSATYQIPVLANALLGTKFNVVLGYPGAAEMEIAIERGEVDGRAATWQTLNATQPTWIKDGKARIVIQSVLKRAPQLPDTPTYIELAKTDEAAQDFRVSRAPERHRPHPHRAARRAERSDHGAAPRVRCRGQGPGDAVGADPRRDGDRAQFGRRGAGRCGADDRDAAGHRRQDAKAARIGTPLSPQQNNNAQGPA